MTLITMKRILAVWVLLPIQLVAKENNLSWSNLSQKQYVENLVACEYKLREFEWKNNLWPNANKIPKPLFADVVDTDEIRQSVQSSLKMQSLLLNDYNILITPGMLQKEIDRMATTTKNSKRLKQIFAALESNPETIANCISRPYLNKNQLIIQYQKDENIHAEIESLAKAELAKYLQSNTLVGSNAQSHTLTYKLSQNGKKLKLINGQNSLVELDPKEFNNKLKLMSKPALIEQDRGFSYSEMLEKTKNSIKIKTLFWQKQSFHTWLDSQQNTEFLFEANKFKYTLPLVLSFDKPINNKAVTNSGSWEDSVTQSSLSGRVDHTATWTGNVMVIWGGLANNELNSGSRYNPATNSWSITKLDINTPIARSNHTAVWTGNEIMIWGGNVSGGKTKTGARYNPVSDIWTAIPTSGAPSKRDDHTAVWTGSEMIVWGGENTSGTYQDTGGRYTPGGLSWTDTSRTGNVPSARKLHTAVWTGNEMIVWGGVDISNGAPLHTGSRYYPAIDDWVTTSEMGVTEGKFYHSVVWTGDEMIVWGGDADSISNVGLRYDPDVNTWTTTSSTDAPSGRYYPSAVWTGNEMIVWNGFDGSTPLNTGGRYNPSDPNGGSWLGTSTINAPTPRVDNTSIWTGSQMIIWGGIDPNGKLNDIGIYSPNLHNVSGILTGLNGQNVVLQINNGDDLTLGSNGGFVFETALSHGSDYEVTVKTNPQNPDQVCTVTNGSGMNVVAEVNNVIVNCVDSYSIGVTVTGLATGNSVFLKNNENDLLEVDTNNLLTNFSTKIGNGFEYLITFDTQPTGPNQTCSIAQDEETGTVNFEDINVAVTCTTNKYDINISVSGLVTTNSVTFANDDNADTLTINGNGATTAALSSLDDGSGFTVSVTIQPSLLAQKCVFSSANEMGILNGSDTEVKVHCVTANKTYTAFEDVTLQANDADGSVVGVNDNSVLINQAAVNDESLQVQTPGTFTVSGIGGEIILATNGTFTYNPPENLSGLALFDFQVTHENGSFIEDSSLTIEVLPVNDAPSFNMLGDVLNASEYVGFVNNMLNINGFADNFVFGPADENGQGGQAVAQFIPTIFADSGSVLAANGVTVSNQGDLTLEFTSNLGVAIVQLVLQDDGETTNGGEDKSLALEFVVSYNHLMFLDGFETPVVGKLFNYLDSVKSKSPLNNYPIYDIESDSILYYGHQLKLNSSYLTDKMMQVVKLWVDEIDSVENLK